MTIGSRVDSAMARKCATMPRWGGLLYIGETCSRCVAPAASISFDVWIARWVSFEPAPAITGTRPPARSTTASTTARCSYGSMVAASPVEPQGTRNWTPSAICQSTSLSRAAPSSSPWAVNGVTSAVPHPVIRFAATWSLRENVRHREHAAAADQPARGHQRALGEHPPVARLVRQAQLLERRVEDELVRARDRAHAHAGDRHR